MAKKSNQPKAKPGILARLGGANRPLSDRGQEAENRKVQKVQRDAANRKYFTTENPHVVAAKKAVADKKAPKKEEVD